MGIEGGDRQALEADRVAEHVLLGLGVDVRPEVGEGSLGRSDGEAVEGRGVEVLRAADEQPVLPARAAVPFPDDHLERAVPRPDLVRSSGAREGQDAAGGGEGGGPPALQAGDRRVAGQVDAFVQAAQVAGPVRGSLSTTAPPSAAANSPRNRPARRRFFAKRPSSAPIGANEVRFAPVTVAVLGPGGVGGLLAAVLPRALVVSREPLAEIQLRSRVLGERTTSVRSTSTLDESVDVLFVATKATGLREAVERIAGRARRRRAAAQRDRAPGVPARTLRGRRGGDDPRRVHARRPRRDRADEPVDPRGARGAPRGGGAAERRGDPGGGDRGRGAGDVVQARAAQRDRADDHGVPRADRRRTKRARR